MSAQWLSNGGELSGRLNNALGGVLHGLSQPDNVRQLRRVLLLLLALWGVLALVRLVWALFPVPASRDDLPAQVINPVTTTRGTVATAAPVDIQQMVGWHLFGEAGANLAPAAEPEVGARDSSRDGIEKGARETRLNLKLRGIVASTEDGLGHAIIEFQSAQNVYAVGDELPVPGKVVLAKVMPQQVVLDNGGTYELLVLYEESSIGTLSPPVQAPAGNAQQIDKRGDAAATELAIGYRQRLYQDPQSLASVVTVSAVREGESLLGYRVRPGSDAQQFDQLGFQTGDVVTAVNGIDLTTPANTMRLYNEMRSAGEAVFDLQRDGQALTLSVSLGDGAP